MGVLIGIVLVPLIIIVVIAIWAVSGYNNFVRLRNTADEAYSTMDVYLKKRFDLIPNLVETVKGYAEHEKETLDMVTQARTKIMNSQSADEKLEGESQLTGTLKTLFAVSESYPELKANTNFQELQKQLESTEQDIANARKYYNGVIREYNTKTEQFPSSIIASLFHFGKRPMFSVDSEMERENVQVQF